jgi:hypothetical protein
MMFNARFRTNSPCLTKECHKPLTADSKYTIQYRFSLKNILTCDTCTQIFCIHDSDWPWHLWCDTVQFGRQIWTFQKNVLHQNTGTHASNGMAPHLRIRFSHWNGKFGVVNTLPHVNRINTPAATTFLKMEAAGICDIQVPVYQTTRYHVPEHSHLRASMRITGMCLALAVLENGNLLRPLHINTSLSVSHFIRLYSVTMALLSFTFSKIIPAFARN